MASSAEYLEYVLDLLADVPEVSHRKMMGEYLLYASGKLFGGVYDDRFLVKSTSPRARCSRCPPCPTRALRRCCSWTWRTKPPCAPSWRACFRSCPSRGGAGRRFPRVCISSPASITRACSYGDCAITTLKTEALLGLLQETS